MGLDTPMHMNLHIDDQTMIGFSIPRAMPLCVLINQILPTFSRALVLKRVHQANRLFNPGTSSRSGQRIRPGEIKIISTLQQRIRVPIVHVLMLRSLESIPDPEKTGFRRAEKVNLSVKAEVF